MLNDIKLQLTEQARLLAQPYEKYSIDDLANAYCHAMDTGNETQKNIYISALILRFWYQIPRLYSELQILKKDHADCLGGITDAILQACEPDNRKWQTTNVSAEQVINQIISTRFKAAAFYESNLPKNQGRHLECSLDAPIDGDEEGNTLADIIESDSEVIDEGTLAAVQIIQHYINNNKVIEAIIFDTIAFNDVMKHSKRVVKTETCKYTEHSSQFWPYKLMQYLSALPANYEQYFMSKYVISGAKLHECVAAINAAPNQKLYRWVRKALANARAEIA